MRLVQKVGCDWPAEGGHPFFARHFKGNSCWLVGRLLKHSLLQVVVLRSQKEVIFGKGIAWGGVGWTRAKRKKEHAKKKVGEPQQTAVGLHVYRSTQFYMLATSFLSGNSMAHLPRAFRSL